MKLTRQSPTNITTRRNMNTKLADATYQSHSRPNVNRNHRRFAGAFGNDVFGDSSKYILKFDFCLTVHHQCR